jgi:GNAT superfamily N-acetyltransferase
MRARDLYLDACHGEPDVDKEIGTWLCYCIFTKKWEAREDKWHYSGNLVGFAVIYEGSNHSLNHLWVAAAARRKGIARALIAHVRENFPIDKVFFWPLTEDGAALLKAVWPEGLKALQEWEEGELPALTE